MIIENLRVLLYLVFHLFSVCAAIVYSITLAHSCLIVVANEVFFDISF